MMPNPWVLTATRGLDQRMQPTSDGAQGFALEAENMGFGQSGALVMRFGLSAQDLTDAGVTGTVEWIGRHVTNAGVEELWLAANNSGTAVLARRSAGVWASVSFSDTVTVANLRYMCGASLNGFFALMYDSNVNRAHVWDGTNLRRMGLSEPAAPTVADTGAGSYGANARRYRVSFLIKSGDDVVAQSELSDATNTFTPSGGGTAARVTKPSTPDSATHWRVWAISGSTDTYDLYELISGDIVVGTTTYDDSVDPANYDGDFPPLVGSNIPPPSAKYVLSDGSRFIFGGAWESSGSAGQTAPKQNRVWITPALGTSEADTERIPDTTAQKNWIEIGDAGPLTAQAGPIDGRVYVFKVDSVGLLAPTNDSTTPYVYRILTPAAGAVDQRSVVFSENGEGVPSIYFASRTAVYQILSGAIRELSEPIRRDLRLQNFTAADSLLGWDPLEKTLFVQAATTAGPTVGQYQQWLYDVASDRWTGATFGAYRTGWILGSSVLGVNTTLTDQSFIRAAVTALDASGTPRLLLAGATANPDAEGTVYAYGAQGGADGSLAYTSRLRVRMPLALGQGRLFSVGAPTVIYRNPIGSAGVTATLTISYTNDAGDTVSQAATLSATTDGDPLGQSRLTFEGLQLGDALVIDLRAQLSYSGSFDESSVPPAIDAILVPWQLGETLAA